MQFLMFWSGEIRGARKTRISGRTSNMTLGHWSKGFLFVPDPDQIRAALPARHRAAFDRQKNWEGLPQLWADERNNDAPLTMRLSNSRGKIMAIYYFQPMTKGQE
jgi:hypothetical protein